MTATITRADRTTPTGRVLTVEVPRWPGNDAGQHLDLQLTAEDGYQAVRSYSVATSGPGPLIELAVDELPDGEVSPYLVEDARPGDRFEVRGPIGAYFVWRPSQREPVQLIAGGSGIVPLIAMARAHAAASSPAELRMLYSVRTRADALYADELERLAGEGMRLDWVYTRAAPDAAPRAAGRVTAADLTAAVVPPQLAPTVYVCGPTGFVEVVAGALVGLGHAPGNVRTERFGGS